MILRELIAKFGVDFDDTAVKKGDKSVQGAVSSLKALAVVASVAVIGKKLFSFIDAIRQTGDELDKTSVQLGISTRDLQEWRFAAGLAGVDGIAFSQSLGLLQKNAFEAARGSAAMVDSFARLGVAVKDSDGNLKDADTLLTDVGVGLSGLENDSDKVAIALNLMGRSGRKMLPLFTGGAEGIARMRAELAELGGGVSADTIAASVALTDDVHRLDTAFQSVKSTIALAIIPIFTRVVVAITKVVGNFAKLTKGTHVVELGMAALTIAMGILSKSAVGAGISMLIAFAPAILTFGLVALVVAIVIGFIDDLISLLSGGKSIIGEFIDALFGIGSAQAFVEGLTDAWDELTRSIQRALHFIGLADDVDPLSKRETADLDERRITLAENAARNGQIVVNPGESREQAETRFNRIQEELRGEQGGGRRNRSATARRRNRGAITVPTASSTRTINQAPLNVNLTVPPGTDGAEMVRLARREFTRAREAENRQTLAALETQAEPVGT